MTDNELAKAFFDRLRKRGFKVKNNEDAYQNSKATSYELFNDSDEIFCQFDFHEDGSFYRISGFTDGYWQDEVDWKKY